MVNIENNNIVYDFDHSYLDKKGNLVFDVNGDYRPSSYLGVYVNYDNDRLYRIDYCRWDIFGNIIIPEGIGFYVNDSYYKLINFDIINITFMEFIYEGTEDLIVLFIYGTVIPFIIMILVLTCKGIKSLFKKDTSLIKRENDNAIDITDLLFILIIETGLAIVQMYIFSINHHSLINIIISFILNTIILRKTYFAYVSGKNKLDRIKDTYTYTLDNFDKFKIAFDIYEDKDVNKYMIIYFVIIVIYLIAWLVFSFNICNGRI